MGMTVMSAENVTRISYIMYMISGVFTVAAVVIFFALDIAKCWRMVSGKHTIRTVHSRKRQKADRVPAEKSSSSDRFAEEESVEDTQLLAYEEEQGTEILDTVSLDLLQDIVYMQDMTEID